MGNKDEGTATLIKVTFAGDPPRMDFALTRLNNGANITDMQTNETSALGSGELAKIVTDAGEALRRTLEATLVKMKPYQSIEVIIMVMPEAGFRFVGPGTGKQNLGAIDRIRFGLVGDMDDESIHVISPADKKRRASDNKLTEKTIIVMHEGKDGKISLNQDKNIYGSVLDADIIDQDDIVDEDDDLVQS